MIFRIESVDSKIFDIKFSHQKQNIILIYLLHKQFYRYLSFFSIILS